MKIFVLNYHFLSRNTFQRIDEVTDTIQVATDEIQLRPLSGTIRPLWKGPHPWTLTTNTALGQSENSSQYVVIKFCHVKNEICVDKSLG